MPSIGTTSRKPRTNITSLLLVSALLATTTQAMDPAAASALTAPPQATLLEILPPSIHLAASIVASNPQATTYALSCAPPANEPACQHIAGLVLTQGLSTIAVIVTKTVDIVSLAAAATAPPRGLDDILLGSGEQAAGAGVAPVQIAVNCDLQTSGATICTKRYGGLAGLSVAAEIASQLKQLEMPVAVTLAPGEVKFLPVAVTAGIEKLGVGPAEPPSSAGNAAVVTATAPATTAPVTTASPAAVSDSPSVGPSPSPLPTTSYPIASTIPAAALPLSTATTPLPAPPATPAVPKSTILSQSTLRSKVTSTAWIVPTGEAGVRSSNQTKTTSTSDSITGAGVSLDTSRHLNLVGFILTSFVMLVGW